MTQNKHFPVPSQSTIHPEIIQSLNRQNIYRYYQGLNAANQSSQLALKINQASADKIIESLQKGHIQFSSSPLPLPDKVSEINPLSEEARELEIKVKRQNINKKINYLNEQIRGESAKQQIGGILQVEYKEILSKEEHKRKVKQIMQEKQLRKKRAEVLAEQADRKRRQQAQRQQTMRHLESEKQRELKLIKIQQNIKKRRQQHDKSLSMDILLTKDLAKVQNSSRLYQQMESRYNSQVLLPELQQKKQKLKEIRDFHRRYDVETIKQHQQKYLIKSQQRSQERKANSPQWKYEPPARTERLSKLLKQEEHQIKEKLQSRKRKLEEKQKRQQLYLMELKQKHTPIIDEEKSREIQERLNLEQRKYNKMHPNIDLKRIGETYLQIAKSMKRSASQQNPMQRQEKLLKPLKQSQTQLSHHTQQYYEQIRRKRIENILNSERPMSEKCKILEFQAQKLEQKLKQKQELVKFGQNEAEIDASELLLSSIKAKMGIINLLNPSHPQMP